MKKVVIVTAYFNYDWDIRIKYLEHFFEKANCEVQIISSNFNHRSKKIYKSGKKNLELIKVPQYKKNLSVGRMVSHVFFSKKVLEKYISIKPDIIYCITPPNFLFYFSSKYKTKYGNVKLIYEIEDLWPESLPVSDIKKRFLQLLFMIWKAIRNRYIDRADGIVLECALYKDYLPPKLLASIPWKVIYLSKETNNINYSEESPDIQSDNLRILYLGSVNNLIDIEFIVRFMAKLNVKRTCRLVFIGGGEKTNEFLDKCRTMNVTFENYGEIYEEEEKASIIQTCHFALNIMKHTVAVGATMKLLEYAANGIPIVNNIAGDTVDIIENYKCGYNVLYNTIDSAVKEICALDQEQYLIIKNNTRQMYDKLFSTHAFYRKFSELYHMTDYEVR